LAFGPEFFEVIIEISDVARATVGVRSKTRGRSRQWGPQTLDGYGGALTVLRQKGSGTQYAPCDPSSKEPAFLIWLHRSPIYTIFAPGIFILQL